METPSVTTVETPRGPRWIEFIDVEELRPDPRNPKLHADEDLDASLERFGYTEAVTIDERTGLLSAGHGRRETVIRARKAGRPTPDGIVVDGDRWLIPVQRGWSSKDDDEAMAYLVASNYLTTKGGYDDPALAAILERLTSEGIGLEGVGWSAGEVDDLLASLASPPSLDDLEGKYGEPHESDMWPVLRFKVSPKSRTRYLALVDGREGSDADLFDYILDLAEAGLSDRTDPDRVE